MNNKVAAFGQRRAGVYLLSEIYDPDSVTSSVQNINKVIPAIGSLVVDDTVGEHNTLYVVYSVDAITHKSTLVRAGTRLIGDEDETDMRMLFFDPNVYYSYYPAIDTERQDGKSYYTRQSSTVPGQDVYTLHTGAFVQGTTYYERHELYRLAIDSRVSVYTSNATHYIIYHTSTLSSVNVSTEVMSQYYLDDNGDLVTDQFIPMDTIIVPSTDEQGHDITCDASRPRDCFTDITPISGDKYLVVVYGEGNNIISQFSLLGHSMSALTALNNAKRVIVGMDATSTQHDGNDFYIIQNQDPREVPFNLVLTYDDGDSETIAIDNVNAFAIVEGDLSSVVTGTEVPVVFKYFPSPTEVIQPSNLNRNFTIGPTGRYITITKMVQVRESVASIVRKISPILYYSNSRYNILPLVYFANQSEPAISRNIPGYAIPTVTGFTGTSSAPQTTTLNYFKQSGNSIDTVSRKYTITLSPSDIDGIFYYYKDAIGSTVVYGKKPRPKLTRTASGDSTIRYVFNSTLDTAEYSAEDIFLKNYYYNASPPTPYSGNEALRPAQSDTENKIIRPTHFRIRKLNISAWDNGDPDVDVIPVVSANISIHTFFSQPESSRAVQVDEILGNAGAAKPTTAIIEFLYIDSLLDTTDILYGVGVDVYEQS